MAEVAEGAQAPVAGFRFAGRELDAWCDGVPRELVPNRDFPAAMDLVELEKRLRRAAWRRGGHARVWREKDLTGEGKDKVFVVIAPWSPPTKRNRS
jgi:hypothetical protein